LPAGIHGKREYCNDAHKQAYYRQQVQREQREKAALVDEIERLKAHIEEQNQEIQQHLWVITDLKRQLDLERRYLLDTQARGFISFLKKQPMTPLIQKILAGRYLPQTGTHWMDERYLRQQHILVTDEDLLQFKDLWKVMILESFRDDF
jgi:ADP-ribose pyrophosphatase YjhB (NUDIX family)